MAFTEIIPAHAANDILTRTVPRNENLRTLRRIDVPSHTSAPDLLNLISYEPEGTRRENRPVLRGVEAGPAARSPAAVPTSRIAGQHAVVERAVACPAAGLR